MQNYELMLLLNPNTMDEVDEFLDGLKKIIHENKGDLVDTKLLGKRQLAYPINNMNYANYVHLDVKIEPETLPILVPKLKPSTSGSLFRISFLTAFMRSLQATSSSFVKSKKLFMCLFGIIKQ